MSVTGFLAVIFSALLVENVVFVHLLGITPILRGTRTVKDAVETGLLISVVTCLTSLLCCLLNGFLLIPYGLTYLRTFLYVMIIALCLSVTGKILKRNPNRYAWWKGHLPYLTANCVILGSALMVTNANYAPLNAAAFGLFAGLGFTFCGILFAAVCIRLKGAKCPKAFQGMPIALITLGLIAMVFLGFHGLKL